MIWSLPFGTPEGAYGLSYRIIGHAAEGQLFTPSDQLTVVFTTPGFTGDIAAAEQAIFAARRARTGHMGAFGGGMCGCGCNHGIIPVASDTLVGQRQLADLLVVPPNATAADLRGVRNEIFVCI